MATATEHIIKIKLEFANVTPKDRTNATTEAAKLADDAVKTVETKMAEAGGAAEIEVTNLENTWSKFDWAHPIMSIKNLWADAMTAMENRFGKVAMGIAGLIIGVLVRAFMRAVDVQDQLVKTFVQLQRTVNMGGKDISNFGDKIAESMREIGRVSMETGGAVMDITNIFTHLAKMRVPTQDLQQLTKLSFLGAKALGANVDQMTDLVGLLRVQGNLNVQQLGPGPKGLLGNLTRIQNATGLTENEMSGLLTQIAKTTQYMSGWGASAQDIENMAEATATLTGLMGKLGLGAGRASEIMDRLMDPSQIGENAMMIRQMGMSMQEYMNMLKGGAVDQNKLTMGLVKSAEAGARMAKNVNPFAAQQIAVMRGFKNVTEMQRIANQGAKTMADMKDGVVDFNQKAAEGMSSMKEQWSKLKGTLQGALMPVMGKLMGILTNLATKIGNVLLSNMPKITAFLDKMGARLMAIDWNKVGEWVSKLFEGFAKGVKILPTLLPILAGLFIALKAFKMFGGGAEGGGGIFGGIGKGIGKLGEGLKGVGKMLGAAGALLIVAAAFWVLSEALLNFEHIDWMAMLKGVIALVALSLVMIGLGALFLIPGLGEAVLAFAAALLMVAASMWILSKALENLQPEHLTELAKIASPAFILHMAELGVALAALALPMMAVGAMNVLKLVGLGKAIKDLALGLYVLSKTPPIKDMNEQIKSMSTAIETMAHTHFSGNAKDAGEGFKAITDSMMQLTTIDPAKLANLAGGMQTAAAGIGAWLDTMEAKSGRGGILKFLGISKDLKATAEAFKDMALGLYVFGASAKLLPEIQTMMQAVPALMDSVTKSLENFDKVKDAARTFNDIINDMRQAAMSPVTLTTNAQAGPGAMPTTQSVNLQGSGTMDITAAFSAQTDKLIEAIKVLQSAVLDKQDAQYAQLSLITRYTKQTAHL
jgi:hypothetical protein